MVRMLVAKPRRNQQRGRVAEQFVAGVAEEVCGLRIDQRDAAVATDDHHRVRRRFEQTAELVVSFNGTRVRNQNPQSPLSCMSWRRPASWLPFLSDTPTAWHVTILPIQFDTYRHV